MELALDLPTLLTESPGMDCHSPSRRSTWLPDRVAVAGVLLALVVGGGCDRATPTPAADRPPAAATPAVPAPLASWNDGAAQKALLDFVGRVTREGSADFVAVPARIAVFDNDGTLWSEQPMYVQVAFALDRVKALAPQHPEWTQKDPFKSILAGNLAAAFAGGERGIVDVIAATHVGNTTDEFETVVKDWIASARNPKTNRLYTDMVFQPMIEVLAYLRANQFKTYIVSGGGVEFMRPWTERTYGIPPEQVIGSRARMKYEVRGTTTVLSRLADIDLVDDKAGKPVGIQQVIGRRPVIAFGNSDGDFEMLEWTTSAPGPRLGLIVHHTDDAREWAYDRGAAVGRLERGLDEAPKRGWVLIDMKQDWRVIHPFEKTP